MRPIGIGPPSPPLRFSRAPLALGPAFPPDRLAPTHPFLSSPLAPHRIPLSPIGPGSTTPTLHPAGTPATDCLGPVLARPTPRRRIRIPRPRNLRARIPTTPRTGPTHHMPGSLRTRHPGRRGLIEPSKLPGSARPHPIPTSGTRSPRRLDLAATRGSSRIPLPRTTPRDIPAARVVGRPPQRIERTSLDRLARRLHLSGGYRQLTLPGRLGVASSHRTGFTLCPTGIRSN
ncbi:hypothetical protein JK358_20105 [Nocardia sp. 2]|uniref:Uncharacterized protein n=1 Tax=Nocardia acididurans TaxID=2802282 RepID=A0ABS1M994_9NOCA|nr:hypothetical protein [Nocardia acididurans]MBL1076705.1 hypothetical protein [Nocardia acididurans]